MSERPWNGEFLYLDLYKYRKQDTELIIENKVLDLNLMALKIFDKIKEI